MGDPDAETDGDSNAPAEEQRIPDESTLLGATGVEQEVLAEAARAEGELADPSHAEDEAEETGTEV